MDTVASILFDLQNNDWNAAEIKLRNFGLEKPKKTISSNVENISGLWYIPNYLTEKEINSFKKKIDTEINFSHLGNTKSRRVAHFGYNYSYDQTGLTKASPIPDYLLTLVDPNKINDVLGINLIDKPFQQLIINEYKPGQQIAYHTDHPTQFGSVIACITIGQSVPIKFKKDTQEKTVDVQEGSLYIMTGESRYSWKHSLINDGDNNRYSLTYRFVNK